MPSTTAITASTASGHSPAASKGRMATTLATRAQDRRRQSGEGEQRKDQRPTNMGWDRASPRYAAEAAPDPGSPAAHSGRDGEGDRPGRGIRQAVAT